MKQTTINLPSGKNVAGYIDENGTTWKDPNGTARIDYGTIVNTNGGTYQYTPNGSVKVPDGTKNQIVSTPGPTATKVSDATGKSQNAYLINGQAYTDPAGTQRVANGSVVQTGGGTYYKSSDNNSARLTAAVGDDDTFTYGGNMYKVYRDQNGNAYVDAEHTTPVPSGATINSNSINSAYGVIPNANGVMRNITTGYESAADSYESAMNAKQKIIDEDINSQLRRIASSKDRVKADEATANAAAQQMYLNSTNPYGLNAERLAALGLTKSGFAESSLVSMMNTYQNAVAGNASTRMDAMIELELAAEEAIAEGNRQKYDLYAEMYQNLANISIQKTNAQTEAGMHFIDQDQQNRQWQASNDLDWAELEQNDRHYNEQLAAQRYQFDKTYAIDYEKAIAQINQIKNETVQNAYKLILSCADKGMSAKKIASKLGIDESTIKTMLQQLIDLSSGK